MGRSITAKLIYGVYIGEGYWEGIEELDWFNDDFCEDLEEALVIRVGGFEGPPEAASYEGNESYWDRRWVAQKELGLELVSVGWLDAEPRYALAAKCITDYSTEDLRDIFSNFDYEKADKLLHRALDILKIPVEDDLPHWWLDYSTC